MIDLVPEEKIPPIEAIVDVPTTNLLEVYKVCLDMESLCEKKGGVGLSAVQVGIPWKLFLVKHDGSTDFAHKGEYGYFLNCEYEPTTDQRVVSLEGCLSLRSPEGRLRHFQVERYADIRVTGFRLMWKPILKIEKFQHVINVREQATVFQHEIDHHHGLLLSSRGREIFLWR